MKKTRSLLQILTTLCLSTLLATACIGPITSDNSSAIENSDFTITWKNYDDSVLEVDYNVPYGAIPTYNGATPTRITDVQTYTFSTWSPSVSSVTSDQAYTAQFDKIVNEKYQFGSYPQSKVIDDVLISSLNTSAGALPSSSDSQSWTDYGYYISGYVSSYMWYIDLVNEEDEYRGVYFTTYRPYYTSLTSSSLNSFQPGNGYSTSLVYWFKYEPITWRVLDVINDEAFLMADLVLDSQDYHYSDDGRTVGGSTVYSNNYEHSHIRSRLNDNFYNTAFSLNEKEQIINTTVENSTISTGYDSNEYACTNTSDKVFLLSYAEATSTAYELNINSSRMLQPSAYAQSQGANSFWWLRSPHNTYDGGAKYVNNNGDIHDSGYVIITYFGIVPALWILF